MTEPMSDETFRQAERIVARGQDKVLGIVLTEVTRLREEAKSIERVAVDRVVMMQNIFGTQLDAANAVCEALQDYTDMNDCDRKWVTVHAKLRAWRDIQPKEASK